MQAYVVHVDGVYKVKLWSADAPEQLVVTSSTYEDARDRAFWVNIGLKYAGVYQRMPEA